jgi:hypothetical protein
MVSDSAGGPLRFFDMDGNEISAHQLPGQSGHFMFIGSNSKLLRSFFTL